MVRPLQEMVYLAAVAQVIMAAVVAVQQAQAPAMPAVAVRHIPIHLLPQ